MGIGLLESVYEECLCYTLEKRQISFERQKPISVFMDGQDMGIAFKADVIVDNCLILEIKSVEKLNDVHSSQLLNYMRLSGIKTGLLINFNERMFKDGIRRFML
jgi:GxxExxY protein